MCLGSEIPRLYKPPSFQYAIQPPFTDLEIIGQFGAARVAWVHCDTHITHWIQVQLGAFKHEPVDVALDGSSYAQYLQDTTVVSK